jgi:hypothetical protein
MKIVLFIYLALIQAFAMKPAPFENIEYVDAKTKFKLISLVSGETQVFDHHQKKLWSMPVFIGRRLVMLAPDAKTLVLAGNYYFGPQLNLSSKEAIATIYYEGKMIKEIFHKDLFSKDAEKIAAELKLLVKGGGWVNLSGFIKNFDVDWNKNILFFILYDNQRKEFNLSLP